MERWKSRWGLVFAAMGAAVGIGNIWRFPKEVAANGGGAFLIPWAIFFFTWSVPLLIAEFSIGKHTRLGTIGSFKKLVGKKYTWMGAWLILVVVFIGFYYAVVMGWVLKYFVVASSGGLYKGVDTFALWNGFINSPAQVVFFQFLALTISAGVVYIGVRKGIEVVNKILIPSLFPLLIIAACWSLTLPGAFNGLKYLFIPRLSYLCKGETWVRALAQSAWSSCTGYGIAITYACYMRKEEDTVLNPFITCLGNKAASLFAGIAVMCTVFGVSATTTEAIGTIEASSTSLTFIRLTKLFTLMPGGIVLAAIFFLCTAFAALTTMISIIEVATRNFMDRGWTRHRSLAVVALFTFLLGLPSALIIAPGNISIPVFLNNQDFVCGISLILSGLFVAFAVWKYGVRRFRTTLINTGYNDIHVGYWWEFILLILVPFEALAIMFFFIAQSFHGAWWNPLTPTGFANLALQCGIVLFILIILNTWLAKRIRA